METVQTIAAFICSLLLLSACESEDPRTTEARSRFEKAIDEGRAKGGVVQLNDFAQPGEDFVCHAGEVERIRDRVKIGLGIELASAEADDVVPVDSNAFVFVSTKNLSARMFPIREFKLEGFQNDGPDCRALPGLKFMFRLGSHGHVDKMQFGKSD